MKTKSENRHNTNKVMITMFVIIVLGTLTLAFLGKITSEFNFSLGALLTYLGNHTYQNYRTTPHEES